MIRAGGHLLIIAGLAALTQTGGLAWAAALFFRRRLWAFTPFYVVLWGAAMLVAPALGRVPLPCLPGGNLQPQSPLYCALNRHYVDPELLAVAQDLAAEMAARYPGTVTLTLDGGFPFLDGFPLLPHLWHADGRKLDLAFYYTDAEGAYLPGKTRSPVGYFAFEDGPSDCVASFPTLRWDLAWLQPLYPDRRLEPARTGAAIAWFVADPRVRRIFVEPHLARRLGLSDDKIRFQGCRAARHDDHLHVELK